MNYAEAKKRAKERYDMYLKRIELCKKIADKIECALPMGWNIDINDVGFNLSIWKGSVRDKKGVDSGEFKLVCKLIETAFPSLKLERFAYVNDDGKLIFLKAYDFLREESRFVEIEAIAYNPTLMPNCKVEWKTETVRRAVVSDECLGIGGKQ
ncbi:MAG: hypothetical protein ACTSRA_12510 [Promethearchaeota archaeon]